jgi:3-isopropylmalate/(R)-2-methylmalate dehydratase small subunit
VEPFAALTAIAAPLPWADVNTDDISPAPGASSVARQPGGAEIFADRARMGRNAFAAYRWDSHGNPNPDFVLNQAPYDQAEILLAGENFGCGSSRETAVWCLAGIGLRCIIAPSFGDIFYNNCVKNGVLPVRLPPEEVAVLTRATQRRPYDRLTVDLEAQLVSMPGGRSFEFQIGEYQRHMLLSGLDEIAATLSRMDAIEAHERWYYSARPWLREGA